MTVGLFASILIDFFGVSAYLNVEMPLRALDRDTSHYAMPTMRHQTQGAVIIATEDAHEATDHGEIRPQHRTHLDNGSNSSCALCLHSIMSAAPAQ